MPLLNENSKHQVQNTEGWFAVRRFVKNTFGKRPDINAILFLIGMNELGEHKAEWEKEEKQNLMHIAICRLFEKDGHYKFVGKDQDGWPHYEVQKGIPNVHLKEQEGLLKEKIVVYFQEMEYI
ncbi:MAG: hypothetical protein ACI8V8_002362 [Chitinophagales bacterium]|jgi:hypothetical protein